MQIKNMKITDIIPYDKNPRINDEAVEAVANSIKEFGWRAPIVVDKDMVIICGHTRLKAASVAVNAYSQPFPALHFSGVFVSGKRVGNMKSLIRKAA